MLARTPTIDTRPASAAITQTTDLIAGNEFLKLLYGSDESQRKLHSGEYDENERAVRGMGVLRAGSSDSSSRATVRERRVTRADHYQPTADPSTHVSALDSRGAAARSLNYKSRNVQNEATATTTPIKVIADESKQVVKLVTSGSKIVFLEEYDDNDAVVDAVARDIDLQKENVKTQSKQMAKETATKQVQMQHGSNPTDEVKVVAVSVSSSSKRGGFSRDHNNFNTPDIVMSKQANKFSNARASLHRPDTVLQQYQQDLHERADNTQSDGSVSAVKLTLTTTPPTAPMTASATSTMDDFVNRSHKSEFSIEEAEPLTMSPQKLRGSPHAARASSPRSLHTPHAVSGRAVKMAASLPDVVDSENSASTNIQNVLAAPLVQSASMRTATVSALTTYHRGSGSSNRNSTSSHINHKSAATFAHSHASSHISDGVGISDTVMLDTSAPAANGDTDADADVEEKLLPFQTVIYHNTKEGHGPQSRSISYSSLSQNVDDLHAWRHSGILAEAQRNVSESLTPITRAELAHTSEPAKFYSVPSKMYSEPSKFYSEPAKVYSEPAKVYGEPEKFFSEPAKVYGQPSKFYSEPAKVYSQPSKVYGEPAKTYWSPSAGLPIATTSTTTTNTTSTSSNSTTTTTVRPGRYMPSRRPAIVSRIAFGEAQTSTTATLAIDEHAPATMPVPTTHHHHQEHHAQHQPQHTRFHPHAHSHGAQNSPHGEHSTHGSAYAHSHSATASQPAQPQSQSQSHSAQSQPRRVLFNLDKLPYDLLNAPVQSSQHLLNPDFSHSPPAAVTYSSPRQRQCLESAFSASLSQSALQQQQQLQQQRQHSSLSDQHSNQNAKGLPNGDLVKCVSKYNQPSAAAAAATPTESSHHGGDDDDLYTPTPEQNYEIEESVSVMTNGRAHGVQGNSAATTTAKPYRGGIHHQQQQQHHYHGNANANSNLDNNYDDNGGGGDDGIDTDGSKTGNEDEDAKVAYVVEGRNYRKYRVEEKTDDGFIVGEYGVVDHNDGNLRGVRYTADSTINRSLIQKALLTFLKLK
ncbi:serine-rich adhesin for platelets-like [Rhagoletis pomonella]|uniref:serine-rich adhesin for platelets-like n=1 Tax=Rhagoletis pomonella TaxID=28610 RepID=UPI00177CB5B1|nr:serine-rich adhesin for platelets-like [Rhagoletis pomonella]XP_036342682.1 serine-rich adhesin for platelets-like [Rhagoletis pomonella]